MAETPELKIELDLPTSSVNSEVPNEQKIRKHETTKETITTGNETITTEKETIVTESETEITIPENLSPPVFTVTENRSSFTKGNMTYQKVTVTEDVSVKNDGYKVTRTQSQMSMEKMTKTSNDDEPSTPQNSEASVTYDGDTDGARNDIEEREKRTKIPISRLRQAVERVQKDQREKRNRNKLKSSIPKLKESKIAIKVDTPPEPKLEDEFDKIYEEIVENNTTKNIDSKILAVKIEDPDKIESKFEEIIHAYDENAPETQSIHKEVSRLSKIPALRRKDDSKTSKLGAIVDRAKSKNTESKIQDGGFKISATKITTKRFSRENSKEFKHELSVVDNNKQDDTSNEDLSKKYFKEHEIRNDNVGKDDDGVKISETYEETENGTKIITRKTVTTEKVKVGIPVRTEKIVRSLSRGQNKDLMVEVTKENNTQISGESHIKTTGKDIKINDQRDDIIKLGETISREKYNINTNIKDGNSETVNIEEYIDENGQKVIKKTIVKEQVTVGAPIITERIISQVKSTHSGNETFDISYVIENTDSVAIDKVVEPNNNSLENGRPKFEEINNETSKPPPKNISKIAKPIFSNIPRTQDKIEAYRNMGVTKTIESKQANQKSKAFARSQSENVIMKEEKEFDNEKLKKSFSKIDSYPSEIQNTHDNYLKSDKNDHIITAPKENRMFNKSYSMNIERSSIDGYSKDSKYTEVTRIATATKIKTLESVSTDLEEKASRKLIDREEDITEVKGNVSRLLNRLDKKDKDGAKKVVENSPEIKSVSSKIAIFERLEPLESLQRPKIKLEKKPLRLVTKDITEDKVQNKDTRLGDVNVTKDQNRLSYIDEPVIGHENTPIIVKEFWKKDDIINNTGIDTSNSNNGEVVTVEDKKDVTQSSNENTNNVVYRKQNSLKITNNINRLSIEMPTIIPNNMHANTDNINKKESPKILPGKIDFGSDKPQIELPVILPGKNKYGSTENNYQTPKTPPNSAYINTDQIQYEVPKILPEIINVTNVERSYSQNESFYTKPGKISDGFGNKAGESVSTLPGKVDFNTNYVEDKSDSQKPTEVTKREPGKINLSAWQNSVESNKVKVIKTYWDGKKTTENVKINEKSVEDSKLPVKIEIKEEIKELRNNINDSNSNEKLAKILKRSPEQDNVKLEKGGSLLGKATLKTWEKAKLDKEKYKTNIKDKYESDGVLIESVKTVLDNKTIKIHHQNSKKEENLIKTTILTPEVLDIEYKDMQLQDSKEILQNKAEPKFIEYERQENNDSHTDTPTKAPKRTPGKLNLDFWYNEVISNKEKIGKIISEVNQKHRNKTISEDVYRKTSETQIKSESDSFYATETQELDFIDIEHELDINKTIQDNNNDIQFEVIEAINLLPTNIEYEVKVAETNTSERIDLQNVEKTDDAKKPKPGKLNLDVWQNAVKSNNEKIIKTNTKENKVTLDKIHKDKSIYKYFDAQDDTASLSPIKINSVDIAFQKSYKNEMSTVEHTIETTKAETISMINDSNLDFKEDNHLHTYLHTPTQFPTNDIKSSSPKTNLQVDNKEKDELKKKPGKINLDIWLNEVENNKLKIGKGSIENYQLHEIKKGKQEKYYSKNSDLYTNETDYNNQSSENEINMTTNLTTHEFRENISMINDNLDKSVYSNETISDPELIDEDHVVKENSFSIIGRIKPNKYFIPAFNKQISNSTLSEANLDSVADGNKVKNSVNESIATRQSYITDEYETLHYESSYEVGQETSTNEFELNNNTNKNQNYFDDNYDTRESEASENRPSFGLHKAQSTYTLDYEDDEFGYYKNDGERSKSLADMELGNVIEGQVQKLVQRMGSLDFEKQMNTETSCKINIREMPKKMSVLEKIALFEGKATTIRPLTPRTKRPEQTVNNTLSEREIQRRIKEFRSAKMSFGNFQDMLYLKLSNDEEIPALAVGTALVDSRLTALLISAAIDMGYRAIDCAYIYGNEKEVGQAIRDKIEEGVVTREELFIMSKLWSTCHRTDLVEKACRQSLDAMGLDYFDLYMIHNPMSFKEGPDPIPKIGSVVQYSEHDYLDAWYGMEQVLQKGLTKSIGVSNFNVEQLQRVMEKGKITPVVNQIECHPYLTQPRLREFCNSHNITLSCFGTLGSKGTPREMKSWGTAVIDDPLVQVMASGLGVTPAQLLIRYQLESGHNVVVKSSSAARLWENMQALTFTLETAQVDALSALNRNKRTFTYIGMGDTHKNYPFKNESSI